MTEKTDMKHFTQNIGSLIVLSILFGGCRGYINVQGEVFLAGLFGIFERNSDGKDCGTDVEVGSVMTVEAVKWYIQKLNDLGNLPFKVGK